MERIKVFLVDDHQLIVESLALLFPLMENIELVGTCTDSREVITELSNRSIDLVITDYNMPHLDGIQLTKQLKAHFPKIKVLVLTVSDDFKVIADAFSVGARGYIMKKSGRKDLQRAIETIHNGHLYFGEEAMLAIFSTNDNRNDAVDSLLASLTKREIEIIQLISAENTTQEIGEKLFISSVTVETHRHNILKKLGVKSSIGVVKFALRTGLI